MAHANKLTDMMEEALENHPCGRGRDLRARLLNIVEFAINFDAALAQQRAWWFAAYPDGVSDIGGDNNDADELSRIRFDEDTMEVMGYEPGHALILMISPGPSQGR